MHLDLHTIKDITTGAVRIEKEKDGIHFYRFTKAQEALYKDRKFGFRFYEKSLQNAGIKIMFKTDSETLFLKGNMLNGGGRGYYSLDVFANGAPVGYIDNFSDKTLEKYYAPSAAFSFKAFSKTFALGTGEKTVCVYFPWSAIVTLEKIAVEDGAFVVPYKPQKTLLAFGDSITHGYDALRPSMRYVAKLCDALGAAEYNKAIGGEVFFPALAEEKDDFVPDYITVAYGTNDWANLEKEEIAENCNAFYKTLAKNYPSARIFAITPIWRGDMHDAKKAGTFMGITDIICEAVRNHPNVEVIQGIDLVPHDMDLYADGRLHPNDAGFAFYADNLIREIQSRIQ